MIYYDHARIYNIVHIIYKRKQFIVSDIYITKKYSASIQNIFKFNVILDFILLIKLCRPYTIVFLFFLNIESKINQIPWVTTISEGNGSLELFPTAM